MSEFTDRNADQVQAFSIEMANLGLSRVSELLLAMFESSAWHQFRDGTGTYTFLPGEFDYFLTQQGVTRDHVVHGIRDVTVKARLDEAMDESRTGEAGYRRTMTDAREQLPERPGRPVEPFGYGRTDARLLGRGSARTSLGVAPRKTRLNGGRKPASPPVDHVGRITRHLPRLDADELAQVLEAVNAERQRRLDLDADQAAPTQET